MKNGTVLMLLFLIGFSPGWAQEVSSASGQSNQAYGIASTTGETFITTLSGGDILLTQGFHQPNILVLPRHDMPDVEGSNAAEGGTAPSRAGEILIFPNPVKNRLSIEVPLNSGTMNLVLSDPMGKVLIRKTLEENQIRNYLDLSEFSPQTYFLEIRNAEGNLVKTAKVLKIND